MASTLREIAKEPHVAGTDANRRVAEKLAKLWKENGLEREFYDFFYHSNDLLFYFLFILFFIALFYYYFFNFYLVLFAERK